MITPVVRPGQANVLAAGIKAFLAAIIPLIILGGIASMVKILAERLREEIGEQEVP